MNICNRVFLAVEPTSGHTTCTRLCGVYLLQVVGDLREMPVAGRGGQFQVEERAKIPHSTPGRRCQRAHASTQRNGRGSGVHPIIIEKYTRVHKHSHKFRTFSFTLCHFFHLLLILFFISEGNMRCLLSPCACCTEVAGKLVVHTQLCQSSPLAPLTRQQP